MHDYYVYLNSRIPAFCHKSICLFCIMTPRVWFYLNSWRSRRRRRGCRGHRKLLRRPWDVTKRKVVSASSFVAPTSLPPTASATKFHSLHSCYQKMMWQGLESNLDATGCGWKVEDNQFTPAMTAKNTAPNSLLKIVQCNCTTACTTQHCTCGLTYFGHVFCMSDRRLTKDCLNLRP